MEERLSAEVAINMKCMLTKPLIIICGEEKVNFNMSEEVTLTEKIIEVQVSLKAPKNQRNDFGNYNYRSAEDILEELKPILAGLGLLMTITDEIVRIEERYYVKAVVSVTDGKDQMYVEAFAREQANKKGMDQAQITGAASSYARKYALSGMFAIDDSKQDPDSDDNRDQGKKTNKIEAIREIYKQNQDAAIPIIMEFLKTSGLSGNNMKEINKLDANQLGALLNKLNKVVG